MTFRRVVSVTAMGAVAVLGVVPAALAGGGGVTSRVSVSSTGRQGDTYLDSGDPSLSADGRFVAFASDARIVRADENDARDVYVRDRLAGVTQLVSTYITGVPDNGGAEEPSISADGRFVAFSSYSSNLVPNDTNHLVDVFVRDRFARVTRRVSTSTSGEQANDDSSYGDAWISADGRFVAFDSAASNLVPGDTNDRPDVFIRDMLAGVTRRVSVSSAGAEANHASYPLGISRNGRFVVFWSHASNLVPGDTNIYADVFVRDRWAGLTLRVSVSDSGAPANGESIEASISEDGRLVAFSSWASNLVAGDTNDWQDVFVRNLASGVTQRLSISTTGAQGNRSSWGPTMSADGGQVAFTSLGSSLVQGDTNASPDVLVRNRRTGITRRVSVSTSGVQGNGESGNAAISADGKHVAFGSYASNLIGRDTNRAADVFVRDPRFG